MISQIRNIIKAQERQTTLIGKHNKSHGIQITPNKEISHEQKRKQISTPATKNVTALNRPIIPQEKRTNPNRARKKSPQH